MATEPPLDETYRTSFTVDVFECPEGHGRCWFFNVSRQRPVLCPTCGTTTSRIEQIEYNPNLPLTLEEQYAASSDKIGSEPNREVIEHGRLRTRGQDRP
jgi:hypothetical protein